MNCKTCLDHLLAELDSEAAATVRPEVSDHLSTCLACQRELASLIRLRKAAQALPREIAPQRDLWPGIEARLGRTTTTKSPGARWRWWLPVSGLAAACLALAFLTGRHDGPAETAGWAVTSLAGSPRVNAKALDTESTLRVGQWLVTGEEDRAALTVGTIGHVELAPRSRLRLLAAGNGTDHRLELREGTLSAFIWAPPRLFFVETPGATAVDLGCAYTLSVNAEGEGELRVTAGYVSLEHGTRSSVIPAGLRCTMHPAEGPGTPFADEAPETLREALREFDHGPSAGGAEALSKALDRTGNRDTITLWHLLRRASPGQRGAVHDRLAGFAPPPDGVTRESVIAGDTAAIAHWGKALGLAVLADAHSTFRGWPASKR